MGQIKKNNYERMLAKQIDESIEEYISENGKAECG